MSNLSEIAAMVSATGLEVSNAINSANEMKDTIDRAKRMLFEAMGEFNPVRLAAYMSALDQADQGLNEVIQVLSGGAEEGQAYIAQLHS